MSKDRNTLPLAHMVLKSFGATAAVCAGSRSDEQTNGHIPPVMREQLESELAVYLLAGPRSTSDVASHMLQLFGDLVGGALP